MFGRMISSKANMKSGQQIRDYVLIDLIAEGGMGEVWKARYAHQQGIIHRDVKPSNILLDREGRAYLMDFGIALMMGQQRKTRTGFRFRSVHYASPEQIRTPKNINHQTDVYSFGCVLYEMLTGRPPFDAEGDESESDYAIEDGHVRVSPASPSQFNRRVTEHLEQVVLRALAKRPEERWSGCGEFSKNLREPDKGEDTTRNDQREAKLQNRKSATRIRGIAK